MNGTKLNSTGRERILKIADSGTFTELGRSQGLVTGYGLTEDRPVFFLAQEPSVQGGALGEEDAEAAARCYQKAAEVCAPVIEILDCAGIRLTEGQAALAGLGKMYRAKALAKNRVPLISLIAGRVGGGLAIHAGLSDILVMVNGAEFFVTPPEGVQGQKDEGFAASGRIDFTGDEEETASYIRRLIDLLPSDERGLGLYKGDGKQEESDLPGFASAPAEDAVRMLADDGAFLPLRNQTASGLVTGLIRLGGVATAVLASDSAEVSSSSLRDAEELIRFASAFRIPVFTLADAKAYARTAEDELTLADAASAYLLAAARSGSAMVSLVRGWAGTAGLLFGSKAVGNDLVFAFSGADVEVMDPAFARRVLSKEDWDQAKGSFGLEAAVESGQIDALLKSDEIRKKLISAFRLLSLKNRKVVKPVNIPVEVVVSREGAQAAPVMAAVSPVASAPAAVTPAAPTGETADTPVNASGEETPENNAGSAGSTEETADGTPLEAPMMGKVLKVLKAAGDPVKTGDVVLVMEAMKMENEITAPEDGVLVEVLVSAGQSVESGQTLAVIAAE